MGKIKEAYMIQEEIVERAEEVLGKGAASNFNILEFCLEQNITPREAGDLFASATKEKLQKILNNG